MLIISFGWTLAALLSGNKSCTRRNWNDGYARRFRCGMDVQAWDRLPRAGGQPVAIICLTADPYPERTSIMPEKDYAAEGLLWLEQKGLKIRGMEPRKFWEDWKDADEFVYVVRFQLIKRLVSYGDSE
jgi:hypothetical protein